MSPSLKHTRTSSRSTSRPSSHDHPAPNEQERSFSVILFYKYAPLSDDEEKMALLRTAMQNLCSSLNLTGRILLGMSSDAEGINGTLAGKKEDVVTCTLAMLGRNNESCANNESLLDHHYRNILEVFWRQSEEFSRVASVPPLYLDTEEDFKWSTVQSSEDLFPDLNVKLVKEIISTGGRMSSVKLDDTKKGYLTPEEWHEEIKKLNARKEGSEESDTILIDCRNHKEYEIGHFSGAMDPNTKTFEQFPRWVEQNRAGLESKRVLMYCTGGIRCEKASAYIRRETGATKVQHLKGGIHKYLDRFGSDGLFLGKNFVFDRRVGAEASSHTANKAESGHAASDKVVGQCLYCKAPHDTFTSDGVCTVCREPTLVCDGCRPALREYHCSGHAYLRNCYFTDLTPYTECELTSQLGELEQHLERMAVGKRYKQKRKTLNKQCDRIKVAIAEIATKSAKIRSTNAAKFCRNCGNVSTKCDGNCWGFHGLDRKNKLDGNSAKEQQGRSVVPSTNKPKSRNRASANQRSSKVAQREKDIAEIRSLGLSAPPSSHRNPVTSFRCPPPCTRLLTSSVKGKWCGRTVLDVLSTEFADLSDGQYVSTLLAQSLICLNGIPVRCEAVGLDGNPGGISASAILKNMDTISRVVDWHEPPVAVPWSISVQKIDLPVEVIDECRLRDAEGGTTDESFAVYCCDKPATVPVHPAGPYLSNTLTMMVEGQEGLEPRSLRPCHRLDRCTSGLTICATSPSVARLMQRSMEGGAVKKLYIARVKGAFPSWKESSSGLRAHNCNPSAFWTWGGNDDASAYIEVDAPIENIDPINGIRAIRKSGKPSKSRFRLISYDSCTDTSLVACYPVTGRGHQLRVHLQHLGFPINEDVQYGHGSSSSGSGTKAAAVQAVMDASKCSANNLRSTCMQDAITDDQFRAARDVCRCCNGGADGIEASFSAAQLLDGGHSIDLHALKYKVTFEHKAKRKKRHKPDEKRKGQDVMDTDEGGTGAGAGAEAAVPLTTLEFSADLPAWASACKNVVVPWL